MPIVPAGSWKRGIRSYSLKYTPESIRKISVIKEMKKKVPPRRQTL